MSNNDLPGFKEWLDERFNTVNRSIEGLNKQMTVERAETAKYRQANEDRLESIELRVSKTESSVSQLQQAQAETPILRFPLNKRNLTIIGGIVIVLTLISIGADKDLLISIVTKLLGV